MKKIYPILCFIILAICRTYAQTGSLKGQITSSDGKPAPVTNSNNPNTLFMQTGNNLSA